MFWCPRLLPHNVGIILLPHHNLHLFIAEPSHIIYSVTSPTSLFHLGTSQDRLFRRPAADVHFAQGIRRRIEHVVQRACSLRGRAVDVQRAAGLRSAVHVIQIQKAHRKRPSGVRTLKMFGDLPPPPPHVCPFTSEIA